MLKRLEPRSRSRCSTYTTVFIPESRHATGTESQAITLARTPSLVLGVAQ
jgi:hypothetical protein